MEIECEARPRCRMTRLDTKHPGEPLRNLVAFWLLGLFNNAAYVIMIAGANEISAASVGLVYFCAVFPAIFCKATGPYWFHLVTYRLRMTSVALLMVCSYTTVALSTQRGWQLVGVVFASLQGGLGEASCLALTSFYSGREVVTAWSSGTGFAGVFGYTWVAALHVLGGMSFKITLLLANTTPLAFLAVYYALLKAPHRLRPGTLIAVDQAQLREALRAGQWHASKAGAMNAVVGDAASAATVASSSGMQQVAEVRRAARAGGTGGQGERAPPAEDLGERQRLLGGPRSDAARMVGTGSSAAGTARHEVAAPVDHPIEADDDDGSDDMEAKVSGASKACRMTWRVRVERTAVLWPYMVPLTVVYFAEYAMQTGTWTAIGFPIQDPQARHRFYTYSNWLYQAGVFVSRSSGMLYQASRLELWAMPAMQVGWLAFFLAVAVHQFWYNYWLLVPCFITGLLGGAVYVNAFTLISREVDPQYREFSMAAASLADSVGVALADVAGILIQGCLFRASGLEGADFKC